jgi:hypothetical protein
MALAKTCKTESFIHTIPLINDFVEFDKWNGTTSDMMLFKEQCIIESVLEGSIISHNKDLIVKILDFNEKYNTTKLFNFNSGNLVDDLLEIEDYQATLMYLFQSDPVVSQKYKTYFNFESKLIKELCIFKYSSEQDVILLLSKNNLSVPFNKIVHILASRNDTTIQYLFKNYIFKIKVINIMWVIDRPDIDQLILIIKESLLSLEQKRNLLVQFLYKKTFKELDLSPRIVTINEIHIAAEGPDQSLLYDIYIDLEKNNIDYDPDTNIIKNVILTNVITSSIDIFKFEDILRKNANKYRELVNNSIQNICTKHDPIKNYLMLRDIFGDINSILPFSAKFGNFELFCVGIETENIELNSNNTNLNKYITVAAMHSQLEFIKKCEKKFNIKPFKLNYTEMNGYIKHWLIANGYC